MTSQYDAHSKLTQIQWGGIHLPVTSLINNITPRLENNKYIESEADYIRWFGNSRSFDAELVFDTTTGTYPSTYLDFLKTVLKNESQILVHPIMGDINCFCFTYTDSITATNRSGVRVNVSFIESLSKTLPELIDIKSPLAPLTFSDYVELEHKKKETEENNPSFFDMLEDINRLKNQLQGTKNRLKRQVKNAKNRIKNTGMGVVDFLKENLEDDKELVTRGIRRESEEVVRIPIDISLYFINEMRGLVEEQDEPIKYKEYNPPKDESIWEVSEKIEKPIQEIYRNNPNLKGQIIIPQDSTVYYD